MFRGNVVMKGYLKNPIANNDAFAGGWFHSGDLGVVDADGYIQLKDRSKDIIISGGENISSIEIEEVLHKHAEVVSAAVVAMPHAKWGETPCAFVELADNAGLTADDLTLWCKTAFGPVLKCPSGLFFKRLSKHPQAKCKSFRCAQQAMALAAD